MKSVRAYLAVFFHAVDQEHVPMLKELANAPIDDVFADSHYRGNIRRQICLTGHHTPIEVVCALPGMDTP